jgi:ribose/xylose/arabinose/galactoside ABC-type transport system permease subunit
MAGAMKNRIGRLLNLFGPFFGLAFVYCFFLFYMDAETRPDFCSLYNTKTIVTQAVIFGIGAIGMTPVIISAGIDLSVGSLVALATVVTATVLKNYGGGDMGVWMPLWAAVAGIAACTLCGFLSGVMISVLRIVPFIVTLGMMQIVRGAAKGISDQATVNCDPGWLGGLMVVEPRPGLWLSMAPGVWIMFILTALMFVVLRYTAFGRYVFAIGSNEATARLCGVRVGRQRVWIYTVCGALTGVAGLMQFSNLTIGDPNAAGGMELDIIAAVIIGGGSFSGGEGSIIGSIVGALIMAILRNGCTLAEIPNWVQNIVIGAIIVIAVGLDRLKHARQA